MLKQRHIATNFSAGLVPVCLFSVLVCGCHDNSTSPTVAELPVVSITTESEPGDGLTPLTRSELESFLEIVRRLPAGTLPRVEPNSQRILPAHKSEADEMREYAEAVRQEIRGVLAPESLADLWQAQGDVQTTLRQMSVDPGDFGKLAVKVSLAWGAASLSRNVPLEKLQQDANAEVERLIAHWPTTASALRSSGRLATVTFQRQQVRDAIEASVSLAEFAGLLAAVPDESVHVVRQYAGQLRSVMADSPKGGTFEHRVESSPEIRRVSHQP